ncbi:MAG: hypothetical protein WCQ95_14840 [Bacteroidota bacterium]
MKKLFTILSIVLLAASVFAQSPEKMSYQAVIRNSSNALVTSTLVSMQISILKGSPGGTAVYVETQTPTTNANGLVNIEIGGGTVVSGTFSSIDWANGLYFIKTETDPSGGTSYTITGTSQLLSVPYALHAKTADTLIGGIVETDPIYIGSQAKNITASDITHLSNLSGVNTGDQDLSGLATKIALGDSIAQLRGEIPPAANGSETKVTSGYGIILSGAGTTASPYNISTPLPVVIVHYIGESYQGGIIFWLDATGQHGLIAATTDQNVEYWYNGTNRTTGSSGDGLYAGKMNTAIIVATQMADNQAGNFAAKACADYSVTDGGVTYGDWYLPSKYELNLLYLQSNAVGGFANYYYWSSTESTVTLAWSQLFSTGWQDGDFGKTVLMYVRAVRAF